MLLFLLSVSSVVALPAAAASDGDLDTTFGIGGKVITPFDSYTAIGQSVAIQPNGKIVVGGVSYTTISTGDFALARYNTDGTLDPTFGTGGKVTTNFGAKVASIWSVAIYKTGPHVGKIVAAGDSTASGLNVFALARYNTDGSLDTTFGGGTGKVATSFALPGNVNVTAQALSVAIQSDDRIVLAGNTVKGFDFSCFDCPANNGFNFALARYDADGNLDTSFGGTGKVITDIGGFSFGGGDAAYSVVIQSDGKIVAAGYGNPLASGNSDFALLRYNTDGTLDTTFGGGGTGKVTTDFGTTFDYGFSAVIQSDGKIVVAGESTNDFALARYNTDGTLDTTTFGGGTGKVTTNFGGTDRGQSVAIQSDDMIVVAGNTTTPTGSYDFALARYNTDGNLDSTFGAGGKVITDFGGGPDVGHSVAIQSDGKIVVAGHGGATHTDFAVARYNGTEPPSNSPPLAVAGPDQVVNEGATVQLDASASSDPDNNALTFNWPVVSGTGPTITLSSYTVANPTFSTLDDGVYTLRVTVNDGNGGEASDEVQVTVTNVAPAVNAGADQSLPFGTLVNVSASFTDPGTMDTWTYSIEWGDGSPVATGSATVGSPITGSHQYVVPGNRTITVCVTDDDLGQGCDSLTVTFVGGTGKITGGVRFGNNGRGGFNVQSDDGVTVKGEMEYHDGSVNLHARTMTVVAVSPDLKKGSFAGVLDDGRTFVVYVEDNGEPGRNDVFKIWVEGTLLNGDGTLTGGNVQIHK
ncbi:MAG: hypothetical protein HYU51_17940 [Candidatus Rokubacteria bacterium]|nr:hypothetical protein [Candidatus Rokubacteria bacterium]